MFIETDRLRLIPVTRELWDCILIGKSNKHFTFNPEWPTEDVKHLIHKYLEELDRKPELLGWAFWVITLKYNGLIVGDTGFKGLPDEKGEVEIGYGLTPSHRNVGYATEAVRALIEWGFSDERVNKVRADCLLNNNASVKVLEKLGMKVIQKDEKYIYWEMVKDTAAKIGLKRGEVKLSAYCNEWKTCYEVEKELLLNLLGSNVIDVQHIGSTAVPGLSAKPIIDLMVGIRNLKDGLKLVELLEGQGYEFRGEAGIPGRLYFVKGNADFRTHHLHMVEYQSEFWTNHLLFRDYLIRYKDAAKEYDNIKQRLATQYQFDRIAYTDGKSAFIQSILQKAKDDFTIDMNLENYIVKRLGMEDEKSLQQLCEKCVDYYKVVEGRNPPPDAGYEILTRLPPDKECSDKFVLGVFNQNYELVGVIDMVKDYPDRGEWIIGLLMIQPEERTKGLGRKIHDGLIQWASNSGANKLRIGVVEDNHNAYRFWRKLGYTETKRVSKKIGDNENVVIVMNYRIKD